MLLNSQQQNNNNVVGSSSNKTNVIKKAVLIPVNTGQAQAPPVQQSQVNTMQMIPSSSTAHQMVVGDKKPSNERLQNPTIRFELSLEKPTSDEFNEFNYNKLALKALKQLKKKSDKLKRASNPSEFVNLTKNDFSRLDGSGELRVERANVSRLLLVYRKKLILSKKLDSVDDGLNESSTMPPDVDVDDENNSDSEMSSGLDNENFNSKKKYKDYEMEMCKYRLKNFTHLGKGYDESDSFIDNSDAYDANIPKNMVPTRGGFYINGETIQLREKKSSSKKKTTTTTKPVDKPKQPKKEEVKTGGGEEDDDDDESDSTFTGSGSSSDESGSSSSGSTGSSDDDSDSSDHDSDSSTLSTSDSSSSESQESIIVISEGQNNNQPPPQPQQPTNAKPTSAVVKKPKILKLTINDDEDEDEENEAAKKAVDKENEKTQVVAENHTNDPSSLVDNKKKRKITESTIIVETMTQSIKPSSLSPSENLVPKKKKLETSATSSTTTTMAVNPAVPKQQPQPHQQHVRTKTGEEKPVTQAQRPNINKPVDNRQQVVASPTTTPNKPPIVATNSAQKPTTSGASPKSIELTPEMREKVAHLKSEFALYRQQQLAQKQSGVTADIMAARFLDLPASSATIYSLEGLIRRHQPHTARLKDLLVSQLIDALELARAQPQREMLLRKYQTIVANTRLRNLENNLRAKMDELRKLVNDEMPKNIEKYSKAMDEYKKQKESMPTSTESERTTTLKNAPRRRFEMSDRLRQMIVGIIQTKMAMYKPPPPPPQSQPQPQLAELQQQQKLEYIQQFFDAELIPIWPKNWMQRNVLLNIYTLKYLPQQQKNPAANTSFENPSPSPLKTTTPTTNLSSPSVSIPQQHQHVSSARQTPTTSLSTGAHSVSVSSPLSTSSSLSLSQPSKIQASASVPHHLTNQAETLNISSKSGKTVQMERIQSHQTLHSPQFMYAKEHQPKQEMAASSSSSNIDYSMSKKQPAPQIQQAVNQTRPTTTTMANEGPNKISYQTPPQTVTPKNQNQNYQAASSTSSSPASTNFFISPAQIESLIRTNKEFSNLIDLTALQPLLNSHFNANANPAALSNKSNQTKNNS